MLETPTLLDKHSGGGWRVSKDVPLSVIGAFILQTIVFAWFLSAQYYTLTNVVAVVSKASTTAYTKDDAHKDRELLDQRFLNQSIRIEELIRRLAIVEGEIQRRQK